MKKSGDGKTTRTVTVERVFVFAGPYDKVRAIAEIDEKGEATAQIAIDWGRIDASMTGDLIRALQLASEWVFDQRDQLVREREAPQTKAVG